MSVYNTVQYNTIQYNTIHEGARAHLVDVSLQHHTIQYNTRGGSGTPRRCQSTTPYNTIQYNTIQCHAMPCHAMPCNAMQCNAMQCNAMQCNAMQCNAMQCNAMQCNAMQYNTRGGSGTPRRRPCKYNIYYGCEDVWIKYYYAWRPPHYKSLQPQYNTSKDSMLSKEITISI